MRSWLVTMGMSNRASDSRLQPVQFTQSTVSTGWSREVMAFVAIEEFHPTRRTATQV